MDHDEQQPSRDASSQDSPQPTHESVHIQVDENPTAGPSTLTPRPHQSVFQESFDTPVEGPLSSGPTQPAGGSPLMEVEPASSSATSTENDDRPTSDPAQRPPNPRRARVDDDEDEDEQRQTNRQRMQSPPSDNNDPSNDHHFHPDMHVHAEEHRQRQQSQPAGPQARDRPFMRNRLSFHIDIHPGLPPPAGGNQAQTAPGGAGLTLPPISFEVRFPFPEDAAAGAVPHVHRTPGPEGAPDLSGMLQRILREQIAQMGSMYAEEPDDPRRAKRLLAGLEEVPEGLVKRMERVAGDEGVVCAVCFESLLSEIPDAPEEKKDVTSDATPMDVEGGDSPSQPTDTDAPMTEAEKAAEAEVDRKIIVLPCAHVFHASCLRPWFTRPHRTTCPTCRFDIDPESLTYAPPTRQQRSRQASGNPAGQPPPNAAASANGAPIPPLFMPFPFPANGEMPPAPPTNADAAPAPASGDLHHEHDHERDEHDHDGHDHDGHHHHEHDHHDGHDHDGHDHPHTHDVPFIIFDVSMLFPIPRPGQPGATGQQAPAAPHPPLFGPAGANDPAALAGTPLAALEQLFSGRQPAPAPAGAQPATGSVPAATAQPQPAPATTAQNASVPPGPRVHWHTFPGAPPRAQGAAPQTGTHPPAPSFGSLFANLFGLGRRNGEAGTPAQAEGQAQVQTQAQAPPPPPATATANPAPAPGNAQDGHAHHHDHVPLPSFEEFMHLVGLPPSSRPQGQPQQGGQPQPQPATTAHDASPADAPPQAQRPPATQGINATIAEGIRSFASQFATQLVDQILPLDLLGPLPAPGAGTTHAHVPHFHHHHHHHHVPPPPPFTVPAHPRRTEKRQWTPPAPPGPTLRERVERRERELGLRCADVSCGLGPSDEDPSPVPDAAGVRQVGIRGVDASACVCAHRFHTACLVSAERVAGWSGADKDASGDVQVSCPVCRAVGSIAREEWNEGACALA